MANPMQHNWCWLGTTLQCLLLASGRQGCRHDQCPDDLAEWASLWEEVVAGTSNAAVYHPGAIARRLEEEGRVPVTVCQCANGRCRCKKPMFQWKQQSEMTTCWKHMVPKLAGAGVHRLFECMSDEQWWQRCPSCDKKVLRNGGEMAMPA